jgi:exocyst complex protein 7
LTLDIVMKVLAGFPFSLGTLGCRDVRASTLEQSLRKLGVEKLSKDDVQKMQWETLEGKIGNWIQYMRISVSFISLGCFIDSCRFSEILQGIWMPGMVCLISNWKCSNRLPHRSPIIFAGLLYVQVKLLFAAERKLCDQIWYHLDPHREKCFADVTDSSVHMLLSFGEAIAKSKKSPEKLFVLLDMYETMSNLLPEVTASLLLI